MGQEIQSHEVTRLLEAASQGDPQAASQLLPLVYDELRRLAAYRMAQEAPNQTLQPTALVHEAWLRINGNGQSHWDNRAHFFAAAAEAMRRILIENARRKARQKRGGDWVRVESTTDLPIAAPEREEILLQVNDALDRLEAEAPDKARIVKLKFFVGLTNQEVADALGVTERTVERAWAYSKAWLFQEIRRRGHNG